MSGTTQAVAASSERSAQTAAELRAHAARMSALVGEFRLGAGAIGSEPGAGSLRPGYNRIRHVAAALAEA